MIFSLKKFNRKHDTSLTTASSVIFIDKWMKLAWTEIASWTCLLIMQMDIDSSRQITHEE